MRLQPDDRTKLVDAAMGRIPCDIVIANAQIVNVFTGEIYEGSIGIYDGFIAHIQCDPDHTGRKEMPLKGRKVYDAGGAYVTPGFIDAHMHIESTMMTPRCFAEAVVPQGTTTVIADPHEIGNVFGIDGVRYMHESSENLPMRQLFLAPSCVPALPGREYSGASFGADEITELLKLDRVIGLAEVMDFYGVMNNAKRMTSLISRCLEADGFVQGHSCGISGRELSAYACGGPMSDHECVTGQDALDRMRIGINVDARESSATQNLDEILAGTADLRYLDLLTFSTDDLESDDILKQGHLCYLLQKAVQDGMNPVDAVKAATINAAREADIKALGAIAPGYAADLLLLDDLKTFRPKAVFYAGTLVAENGQLTHPMEAKSYPLEQVNSVHLEIPKQIDLALPAPQPDGMCRLNLIYFHPNDKFTTDFRQETLPVKEGFLDLSADPDLNYAAVLNRHGRNTISHAVVRGYGITEGAVASTVAHDSHNVVVIYDSPENAVAAIQRLREIGGGYVCVKDKEVLAQIALPVGGLMANQPVEEIAAESEAFKQALESLGMKSEKFPLLCMAFLPLPVIPNARLTDLGMFDVTAQEFVPMFPDA